MIKLKNVVLVSSEQMKFIIEGMRNPMNSWEKSDSHICRQDGSFCMECEHKNDYCLGENDLSLIQLMILPLSVNVRQHLIIQHDVTSLVIAARKKLNQLPPDFFIFFAKAFYVTVFIT